MVQVLEMSSPKRMMRWLGGSAPSDPHPFAPEVVSSCAVDSCFLTWAMSAKLQMGVVSPLPHL
eukprot:7818925-Alexandrium_andersonii.AAC.1